MVHVLVRFDLEEYESWRDTFEERKAVRAEHGCRAEQLFARSDNDRKVVLLAEWDSQEDADAYFDGADFRNAMRQAGVARKPDVTFLDRVEDADLLTAGEEASEAESTEQESVGAEPSEQDQSERESSADEPDR